MKRKKIKYVSIKTVDLELSYDNVIQISIPPNHYDNYYLWNNLLENILVEMAYSRQVTISFFDNRLYDIFVGFIDGCINKYIKENSTIKFDFCNKRVITELMHSYNFFDYSNAFLINIDNLKNKYYITPLGDNLGIEIKCSDESKEVISIIEKVCCDYNILLERNSKNE